MSRRPKNQQAKAAGKPSPGSLRGRNWRRFLRGPDRQILEELYVPALKEALRYDRCCAYFSSSVLAAAARGFAGLIARLVAMGEEAPHPDVLTVPLPEAALRKLIRFAPAEAPIVEPGDDLERRRAAMVWQFIAEAPYLSGGASCCEATAPLSGLWPHQQSVIRESAEAWPDGRLLCDEDGMGKTIEAIMALRRLLAGRGVRRALLLLPAGLRTQWQDELREKGGLIVPRLEGADTLVWPDGRVERVGGLEEALRQDLLILSHPTVQNGAPTIRWDSTLTAASMNWRKRSAARVS